MHKKTTITSTFAQKTKSYKKEGTKEGKTPVKRPIDDVPFYQFEYEDEDLPLDPAKTFIKNKLDKWKRLKKSEFQSGHNTPTSTVCCLEDGADLRHPEQFLFPEELAILAETRFLPYTFEVSECPSEPAVHEVTNELLKLYEERRKFHLENATSSSALFSGDLKENYCGSVETIGEICNRRGQNKTLLINKKKKVKTFMPRVHPKNRNDIDISCKPELKRKRAAANVTTTNSLETAKTKCDIRNTIKIQNPKLKQKIYIQRQFKYIEGLLPMDPEEQKKQMLSRYNKDLANAKTMFTYSMKLKTIKLMKHIKIRNLELYPSRLVKNALQKIDASTPYLVKAYEFILKEEKIWPDIYPEVMLMDFLFGANNHVREEDAVLIISCLLDLQEDFKSHVKRAFCRHILKSKDERKRLQMEVEPPDYPVMIIRAPVPWKTQVQLATNRLDQILMTTHPVLQAINVLWHQLYNDILIFDAAALYRDDIPLDADQVTNMVNNSCMIAKNILINDWLPRVADLIDAMRRSWEDLIPWGSSYGGRAQMLFNCVHSLMSFQLNGLVQRSIEHFFRAVDLYKGGHCPTDRNNISQKPKRRPFMRLIVSVVGKHFNNCVIERRSSNAAIYKTDSSDPDLIEFHKQVEAQKKEFTTEFIRNHGGKMLVFPFISELPAFFVELFKKILRVGYDIPRIEYLMCGRPDRYGFLHCIHETHIDMRSLYKTIEKIVEGNCAAPTSCLYPIYRYYFPLLANKVKTLTEFIFTQYRTPNLQDFEDLVKALRVLLHGTYFLRDYMPFNLFMLDNRHINNTLAIIIQDIADFVTDYFKVLNQNENRRVCDEFEEMSMKAAERPKKTAEVVALQHYLTECRDIRIFKLKDEIEVVATRVSFLLQYSSLEAEDIHLNSRTFLWPSELEQVLELSASRLNVVRDNLEIALRKKRGSFEKFILSEKQKMDAFRMRETREVLSLEELKEKVDTINALMETLEKCSREAKYINCEEQLLQIDQSFFPTLAELIEKMEPVEKLWKTAYEFDKNYEIWFHQPFENMNADLIRTDVENMSKTMSQLSRKLVGNPMAKRMAEQIRVKIDKFKIYLPVFDAICRHGLGPRHWKQVSDILMKPCSPEIYPTLEAIVNAGIMTIIAQLEEISNAAGKEYELNAQLVHMQLEWKDVVFEVFPYRDSDTYILAAVDDIQTLLDDHILKAQAMRGSPYIAALGAKATDWEDKLIVMQDIIDSWMQVQSTWMYLEPIFSSEDIMRQMPVEGRNFKAVDKTWRKIMKATFKQPQVIEATDFPNLLETFQKALVELESVQKGLNKYLESKRLFFARFFFLSNDELLEILSETKDPLRVQPHLKKCFEGIESLEYNTNFEIKAMISAEGEIVPLLKTIIPSAANGLVEKWLKEVETAMLESVQSQMMQAWRSYFSEARLLWVQKWPGQVVQGISCMAWTFEVEEALNANTVSNYLQKCSLQIGHLVSLIRQPLPRGTRITVEALIVLDVHARDVVKFLVDSNVSNNAEFGWISQLRYYWSVDEASKSDYLRVSMVATDVKYAMEYLGNISRLVVTPLTDRCYRTLMGALKLYLGGAPEGPAGTGKTETCKDLAKAVAKKCVVFNCSDGLDYKSLGKFFMGLAQSGAWACFDEFNRIELEVLSVVALQISTIQTAINRGLLKFLFEDTMLHLDPTCAIFITMNPGYAGRTELPDNLRVLFRPVAMMVPNYAMIGEITLYSNGFDDARSLAKKIVHTYKLCSEQLSSQPHYDYGMRAIKSVLLTSCALREVHQELPEDQIVLRAIIDVNMPKFLEQDIPLFVGIYTDLFPGIRVFEPAREDFFKWLRIKLKEKNLTPNPWFIEKIVQIYEMILVRHGLMIVGGTMAGKTTAYQVLAEVLRAIGSDDKATSTEYAATYRIINPKAITVGQLYGSFDPVSHEWSDGVLAKTFREMVYGATDERNWIVFDGPVDPVWVENLNTVLDDNKKLCLMSGEIIQMNKMMNMVFEPTDLEQASPATISRCGMIYMDPFELGWTCLHKSFVNTLQPTLNEIYLGLYEELVQWLVPAGLSFLQECKPMLETSPMYQYQMLSILFLHFLQQVKQYNQTWFQQVFIFCFVWAYASFLSNEGAKIFDASIRKILYGANEAFPKPKHFSLNRGQMFPEKRLVTDYRYDGMENWWPWLKSDEVNFRSEKHISELVIPTKETCYITYWLNICVDKPLPIIVIGPTGTGKTTVVSNHLKDLPNESNVTNIMNFSARTTAQQVQEAVMSKLDRRRKGVFGPTVGKKCIMFCDDVAIPFRDTYGSQPPLELLRQWLNHGYWSDLKDSSKIELVDLNFVGAMGALGGSNYIYPRLYRHTFVIGVDGFEDSTLVRIFNSIVDWNFRKDYPDKVALLAKGFAAAMITTYRNALSSLPPTPAKSHYTFSLRDISRVMQGVFLVPPKRLSTPEKLGRLWIHETYRVYYDRLIEKKDREKLLQIVRNACKDNLHFTLEHAMEGRTQLGQEVNDQDLRSIFFGNYMAPDAEPKIYDEVESYEKLEQVMKYYLKEYNSLSNSPIDLVLFRFAIEHISRTSRILQVPQANMLMVGLSGSGRRSSVMLAASIADAELLQIQVTKTYSSIEWRDDIKRVLLRAGMGSKPTVFLLNDTQISHESFFEDINSILNTGDLPDLYHSDEKAVILDAMQTISKQLEKKIEPTSLAMFSFFVERIREQLHMALAFSPIGESFKERLRMFPSLLSCCTIDWYTSWPEDALAQVAETFIYSMNVTERPHEETSAEVVFQKSMLTDFEQSLVDMVMYFHVTVQDASDRCFRELLRKNYVTPRSYIELLRCLKISYKHKHDEITMLKDRYATGLQKLDYAAHQVGLMQRNLYDLQPQLKNLSDETEQIMVKIERDTAEAEKKKEVVGADEAAANEAAAAAQAIKDDCESDLQEAIPALEAALEALNTLKAADITFVKSMKNPPYAVKLVLEAVCVMKGIKPERKPDASGRMVDDYWGPSQRMLGDMKFLESLQCFDKDNINSAIMRKIRDKYIQDRDFVPEKIRSASTACEGLCKWVRAMDVYDRVAKIVAPKKVALSTAEEELAQQMEKLNAKRAELQKIYDKLQKLNDFFAEKSREKKGLEDEIDNCEKKLNRAEKLLGGLGGEKSRWSENAKSLQTSLHNAIGDILLAAGCVAYLGFFTSQYRLEILNDWNTRAIEKKIPCSEKFSLTSTLGKPMQIRAWSIAGLPSDNFSIENGIIVTNAHRYPLMIDPQGQANKWIKNMERNNLKVIKQTDESYMQVVEHAIRNGYPVLLENVGESIDSNLFSVLERNVIKQNSGYYIKFGDGLIDYNENFMFYITTCLRNPSYHPETVVMVTVLNFMITEQGLREQLLSTVVIHERPDLQQKKEQLIIESAKNKETLYSLETKILQILSSAEGNILEDENALNILSSSKILSTEIHEKQVVAAATEIEIDAARQRYYSVAKHAAVLFFCIAELANVNPMYQYSLTWFSTLFSDTMSKAPKSNVLEERLATLNNYFTKTIYMNVCRSLFEKDRIVMSFVMCTGILASQGKVNSSHLIFFLTGGVGLDNPHPNPCSSWLTDKSWAEIVRASNLEGLNGFHNQFAENVEEWRKFYDLSEPEDSQFPPPFENSEGVVALILLKCIRPDKIVSAVRSFITSNMNKSFVEPITFDLEASFAESTKQTPLVFLLSAGSDPMAHMLNFAKQKNMQNKFKTISLGQGQGPRAEKMIIEGTKLGHWIVLQNCHVAGSWMQELERICVDNAFVKNANDDFRLWCTSYPSSVFPVSILQNSIKITNDPPKGLKMNMLRSFNSDPLTSEDFLSDAFTAEAATIWLRGVFSLVFFHAVIQERREFGPLGWNIPYEFNDSDLKISLVQLKTFLEQCGNIPFDGHHYLTAECNYGGRVTDDKDRRLLLSILNRVYNQNTINLDSFSLSTSGNYRVPSFPNRPNSIEYISTFPVTPHPEVFGLHENADINRNNKETDLFLSGVLLTHTQLLASFKIKVTEDANTIENLGLHVCQEILGRLPLSFDIEEISVKYPVTYRNSMNTVLRQELTRYNRLLEYIRHSLINIQKALQGQIAMIPELERIHHSIISSKVPIDWLRQSYPSLKPVGAYINDFLARLNFFQTWVTNGEPTVYWFSGFYFTQSFITGVQQNFSRKNQIQIDLITLEFAVTDFEKDVDMLPEVGTYIKGLFLEGCRWNRHTRALDESFPKLLFDQMPVVLMAPIFESKKAVDLDKYEAPIYKTTERRGVLSTTGHSSNFIMFIELPTTVSPDHWINRGAAVICQLDN